MTSTNPYDEPIPADSVAFYTELGRCFRNARIRCGYSLDELAAVINITPQRLEKYERAELVFPIFELMPLIEYMGHPAELEPKNFDKSVL